MNVVNLKCVAKAVNGYLKLTKSSNLHFNLLTK